MQILIIDNNIDPDSWGAEELCSMARLALGATIHVRRAPQGDLPRDVRGFDRIIVSGSKTLALEESPWISQLDDFIRSAVRENKPYLGICYGHQALARAIGGHSAVRQAKQSEYGWAQMELEKNALEAPLMKSLPRTFHTFSWHQDEVHRLPQGMKLLARSERCEVQACQLEDKPIYGLQFHPERSLHQGERSLARRLKSHPKTPLINPKKGEKLFDEKIGVTIFRNFLAMGQTK